VWLPKITVDIPIKTKRGIKIKSLEISFFMGILVQIKKAVMAQK
jgi:hypothetical protein